LPIRVSIGGKGNIKPQASLVAGTSILGSFIYFHENILMLSLKKLIITLAVFGLLQAGAQDIAGYRYSKYPANLKSTSNAKSPDYAGNPAMKKNKANIRNRYTGTVNFAGAYQVLTWGCGTGCLTGVLIDTRDGKIHELPELGANNCGRTSEHAKDDRMVIRKTSRLLLSAECEMSEGNQPAAVRYKAYIWDETNKTFTPVQDTEN
jgi:hypothetical protein